MSGVADPLHLTPKLSTHSAGCRRGHFRATMTASTLRPEDHEYLSRLADAVRTVCSDRLLGLYLFGSAGCGGYEPGPSDLDVQAVVAPRLDADAHQRLAVLLDHARLPCPARRLEFVCYAHEDVRDLTRPPRYAMNFNTGRDGVHHLSLDADEVPGHWFVLDIALGRARGTTLAGPPPDTLFGAVPHALLLQAMREGLAWHEAHEPASPNAVLNACRAWRHAETGELGSKQEGAEWMAAHSPFFRPVVEAALRSRREARPLPAGSAEPLLQAARRAVYRAGLASTHLGMPDPRERRAD